MNIKTRAEKLIYQAAERGDIAGANILVLKNGREVLYAEGGLRDIENSVPMSRDTIFRLYSQTKPVTAAAAILMAMSVAVPPSVAELATIRIAATSRSRAEP